MTQGVSAKAARRTQGERSAATRRALLEATIDVLIEDGYAQLTNAKVTTRAQLSRGAQVHHFPTKALLVSEAIQYLIGQVGEALFTEIGTLPNGPERTNAGLDLLWNTFRGRTFQAVLELSVAVRDPEIKGKLTVLNQVTTDIIRGAAPVLFPDRANETAFQDTLFTVVSTMSGLALSQRVAGLSEGEAAERWKRTKTDLLRLFDPASSTPSSSSPSR